MSTSWQIHGNMSYLLLLSVYFCFLLLPSLSLLLFSSPSTVLSVHSVYFCSAGGVKCVWFTDVLAKKWVGTLKFGEVPLVDRVLPFFTFGLKNFS